MPSEFIVDVSGVMHLSYKEVREVLADIAQMVAPLANVHAEWVTEFDGESGLRKVTNLLWGRGAHADRVHAWQIGVSAAPVNRSENNDFEYIGGQQWDVTLNVDCWGFFDKSGITGSWELAEAETRLMQATFNRNAANLFKAHAKAHYFQKAYPFDINSMDAEPFSDGTQVIVTQSLFQIVVLEQMTV